MLPATENLITNRKAKSATIKKTKPAAEGMIYQQLIHFSNKKYVQQLISYFEHQIRRFQQQNSYKECMNGQWSLLIFLSSFH